MLKRGVEERGEVVIVILVHSKRFWVRRVCPRPRKARVRPESEDDSFARSSSGNLSSESALFRGRGSRVSRVGVHPMHIWGQLPGIHMERVSRVRLRSHYKVVARLVRIGTKVMGRGKQMLCRRVL
jgi:hypothetical protein